MNSKLEQYTTLKSKVNIQKNSFLYLKEYGKYHPLYIDIALRLWQRLLTMNNVSPEKKGSVLKTLAITGFFAIIILIAWLSIQLVNVLPGAFNSLASLAEGVSQYQQSIVETEPTVPLVVTSNTTLVNTGGTVDISWNTAQANGSYVFSYECTEGVAIDLLSADGTQSIECNSQYNLGDTDSVSLAIDSVKNRYTDVTYSVSFLETEDTEPRATGDATLTVVNSNVSNLVIETEEVVDEITGTNEDNIATNTEETTQNSDTPVVSAPTPTTPVYEQEFVYTIPTSDPNGRTDLATRFLFTGTIENNVFTPGVIDTDETGAIQFEVKNLGSKTSGNWTFSVSLPNGGTYESASQKPLKPNERAVLTIGFQAAGVSSHTFEVSVATTGDTASLNNQFKTFVPFI